MISWIANLVQKRGKIIFSILLVIVIVAFVFTIGAGPGIVRSEKTTYQRDFYGVDLNSSGQIQLLQSATMVSRYLDGIRQYDENQFQQQMLMRQVRLYLADQLAIPNPTETQLSAFIKEKRAFQNAAGKFEKSLLENFVSTLQSDSLINDAFVMTVLQEDYRLQALDELLTAPGFVFKEEILASISREQTTWSVEVAELDYASFKPEIDVTDEVIQDYFNTNQLVYRIPEEYTISFVEFTAASVKTPIEDPGEEVLQRYFLTNRSKFADAEKALMPENEETAAPAPLEIYEQIRGQVFNEYVKDQKTAKSVEVANEFIGTLFDNNVQFQSIEFKKMLLEHELKLKALPPFTVDPNSQMIGVVPKELYDEAFRLDTDRYFSDVVANRDNTKYLVAFLESKTAARNPELDEVKDRVIADYTAVKKQEAFAAKGEAIKAAIHAAAGDIDTVASAENLTTTTYESFSLMEKPEALSYQLLQAMEPLKAGETSDMITVGDKGYFIKVTAKNTPEVSADDARYAAISSSLEGYSGFARYQAIIDQLLSLKLEQPAQN